jgi:hypothetical protein
MSLRDSREAFSKNITSILDPQGQADQCNLNRGLLSWLRGWKSKLKSCDWKSRTSRISCDSGVSKVTQQLKTEDN